MKTKLFAALLAGLSLFSLIGCGGKKDDPPIDPDKTVTVNFYVDYNYASEGIIYHTCTVNLNAKITDIPTTPSVNMHADFPNFLGWSTFQLIDNVDDLWDFENDIVSTTYSSLSLYGIWTE
ncbi:MAG TPA: hypothetical protein PKO28_00955 [Bacilli bacterium]|nr:hypothetical protein [Bacilli bacterium]HPS18793.1 hypothetical protein [Bacilli bacterium]